MRRFIIICAMVAASALSFSAIGQEKFGGIVELDRTVQDFGDVMVSDGSLSCEFTLKNISNKPIVIYNVTTTCGCTDVTWSKEPVRAGQSVKISATYSNDEGPYPFDKTLTVNISDYNKPILLKIRGVSHKEKEPLDAMFPVRIGQAGFRSTDLKCGNLEMGESRSDMVKVANLSDSPMTLSFADVTDGLSLKVSPSTIPAGETAEITYTVTSRDGVWGRNKYYASLVTNGRKQSGRICVSAFTKDNFNYMTAEERKRGALPMFDSSNWSMGKVKTGTVVTASWTFTNTGKSTFKTYKVDIDNEKASHTEVPDVAPGDSGSLSVTLDTAGMPQGEALVIVNLTTNSPSRPIINLFITGWIE